MRFYHLITASIFIAVFASCNKGDGCGASTICTEDFRSVAVRLVNASGTAPDIDSVQTVDENGARLRSSSGRAVFGLTGTASGGSVYASVVDDEWVNGNRNSEIRVTLRGFRGGAVVFEEGFTIGADCCHVYKSAGPDLITVP